MISKEYEEECDVRFMRACVAALGYEIDQDSIGTYSERALHKVLKYYLEPRPEYHEIKLNGFIADIKNPDGIIEIQTRAFSRLKEKLASFLPQERVTVVYPVIAKKYLRYLDANTGELSERRSSTKRMTVFDTAYELYNIREFLSYENLSLKLIFLEAEQIKRVGERVKVGKRYRDGVSIEKIPRKVLYEIDIRTRSDYSVFIPEGLSESFTATELGQRVGKRFKYGYSIISILEAVGLIEGPFPEGRKKLYKLLPMGAACVR